MQRRATAVTVQRLSALWDQSAAFRYVGTTIGMAAAWFATGAVNQALGVPLEYSLVGISAFATVAIVAYGRRKDDSSLRIGGRVLSSFAFSVGVGLVLARYAPSFATRVFPLDVDAAGFLKSSVVAIAAWLLGETGTESEPAPADNPETLQ